MAVTEEADFFPLYKWIAPIIAVLIFIAAENGNADLAEQFQESGVGFHATWAVASMIGGVVFGVPVTAIAGVVRIIFE